LRPCVFHPITVRQIAAARPECIVGVRNRQFDGENSHFEHIADFRAFDEDRSSEDVPAGAFVFHLVGDVAKRLLDLIR
jgi:hypothetical protein